MAEMKKKNVDNNTKTFRVRVALLISTPGVYGAPEGVNVLSEPSLAIPFSSLSFRFLGCERNVGRDTMVLMKDSDSDPGLPFEKERKRNVTFKTTGRWEG